MRKATLVLTEAIAVALTGMARGEDEQAAVLLVGVHEAADGRLRLLSRELHVVDDAHCERAPDELRVRSAGWVAAVARAGEIGAAALWVHTHPGGDPSPSRRDALVDEELERPFRVRSGSAVYGSVVLSPADTPAGFAFTGAGRRDDQAFRVVRAVVVGSHLRLVHAHDRPPTAPADLYDRQVKAFGGALQSALRSLRVGLAGAGGTGSAVAEQLVRLGVGHLTVVDPDVLSNSNTTRVYGSGPLDVGSLKVDVLVRHVQRIAPGCSVTAVAGKITEERHARLLAGCDVVFGCTDDEAGRMVLSRLATYQLMPVIDCGVLIDSDGGRVRGIHGRVTAMHPGAACLLCRRRVDPARAAAELFSADEHARLVREGYAPELPGVEPAVVAYTTLAAALAVNELLERLIGYGVTPAPSEVLARVHDRELGTNSRAPTAGHYCDPAAGVHGTGDTLPFLGQAWAV